MLPILYDLYQDRDSLLCGTRQEQFYHTELDQWVVTVITLTLNAGALYVKDLPVEMVLVFGVIVSGAVGVLLAVSAPVSSCRVPELATDENWLRSKVRLADAFPALAT